MPRDFSDAFAFLKRRQAATEPSVKANWWSSLTLASNKRKGNGANALEGDVQFLRDVSKSLTEQNVLFPEAC